MEQVVRLVTYVEVDDPVATPRQLSVSARHDAVLTNGEHVVLLDDRGWASSGPPDIHASTTAQEIAETARMVVGPDEPFDDHTPADMEADHWAALASVLSDHGVEVDPPALGRLPHDVVLGERLLGRLDQARDRGSPI